MADRTPHLDAAIARAATDPLGALVGELAEAVRAFDGELAPHEATDFVLDMVDGQILVLGTSLRRLMAPTRSRASSTSCAARCPAETFRCRLGSGQPGSPRPRPRAAGGRDRALRADSTDSGQPAGHTRGWALPACSPLPTGAERDPGGALLREIERSLDVLERVTRHGDDQLVRFREAFVQRYGRQEVPLLDEWTRSAASPPSVIATTRSISTFDCPLTATRGYGRSFVGRAPRLAAAPRGRAPRLATPRMGPLGRGPRAIYKFDHGPARESISSASPD